MQRINHIQRVDVIFEDACIFEHVHAAVHKCLQIPLVPFEISAPEIIIENRPGNVVRLQIRKGIHRICGRKRLPKLGRGGKPEDDGRKNPTQNNSVKKVLIDFRLIGLEEVEKLCNKRSEQDSCQEQEPFVGEAAIEGEQDEPHFPQTPPIVACEGRDEQSHQKQKNQFAPCVVKIHRHELLNMCHAQLHAKREFDGPENQPGTVGVHK